MSHLDRSANIRDHAVRPFVLGLVLAGCTALVWSDGVVEVEAAETAGVGEQKPKRIYGALGVGISRVHPESDCFCTDVSEDQSAGGSLALGYDINRWLSVEGYLALPGQAEIDFLDTPVGDVEYRLFGVDAIAYVYNSGEVTAPGMRSGFSVYGRVGLGGIDADSDIDYTIDHPLHLSIGAGVEYGWRNGFALRAELQSYDSDVQLAQLVGLKRFGGGATRPVMDTQQRPSAQVISAPSAPDSTPLQTESIPTQDEAILFGVDQTRLHVSQQWKLARLLRDARQQGGSTVELAGHADATGPADYNDALSRRRAERVRWYLVSNGVDPQRVNVSAYGESAPRADNTTAEGRSENRRVEHQLVQ